MRDTCSHCSGTGRVEKSRSSFEGDYDTYLDTCMGCGGIGYTERYVSDPSRPIKTVPSEPYKSFAAKRDAFWDGVLDLIVSLVRLIISPFSKKKEKMAEKKSTPKPNIRIEEISHFVIVQEQPKPTQESLTIEEKQDEPKKKLFPFIDEWFDKTPNWVPLVAIFLGGLGGLVYGFSQGFTLQNHLEHIFLGVIAGLCIIPLLPIVLKLTLLAGIIWGIGIILYVGLKLLGF